MHLFHSAVQKQSSFGVGIIIAESFNIGGFCFVSHYFLHGSQHKTLWEGMGKGSHALLGSVTSRTSGNGYKLKSVNFI